MKYAVIGFGSRGQTYTRNFKGQAELVAVCDKKQLRLDEAVKYYGVDKSQTYLSDKEFFAQGRLADLLIVSTQDADHFEHAMTALELGYHLILEKPMADSYEKCEAIYNKAKEKNLTVFVCHVLRYAPFFVYIKEQIESGVLGKIMTVNLTENVAYWHQAHSFVRGKWGKTEDCTPMIIAKCCHDLDMLYWLMGSDCETVSSLGSLEYYKPENAPDGSADYCCDCQVRQSCPYDVMKFYPKNQGWLFNCLPTDVNENDLTEKELAEALADKSHQFGKCVFKCDNTAVDHQVVNMLFSGGATAHLTMTAFAAKCYREIHVHGTKGNLYGSMDDNKITLQEYGKEPVVIDIGQMSDGKYGHGGGDKRMVDDVVAWFAGRGGKGSTRIENSMMSHKMGFAAEYSRLHGGEPVKLK